MLTERIPEFHQLSVSEKLLLLEELWDDLASHPEDVPVWPWQKDELDRRFADYLAHPAEGAPWSEVQDRLRRAL